jgi:hypothetical protein
MRAVEDRNFNISKQDADLEKMSQVIKPENEDFTVKYCIIRRVSYGSKKNNINHAAW